MTFVQRLTRARFKALTPNAQLGYGVAGERRGDGVDQAGYRPQRYSARYGARDPWLAGGVRAGAYLLWRAMFAAWRPAIFLILLAGALVFGARAASNLDLEPPQPPEHERLAEAVQASVGDGRAWWAGALGAALDPAIGGAPDLVLAEALAPSLPSLVAPDRLARRVIIEGGRSERHVEAVLRAVPSWRREQRLEAALSEHMDAGVRNGMSPPELVFAPEPVALRLERARALYGPAVDAVETWFSEPGGRALVLRGAPGLEHAPPGAALYGDVRDLLIQACALAEQAGRRIGQCRVVFLPKPDANLLVAGLSVSATGVDGQALVGARVLKAAAAAGLANENFIGPLVLGADPQLAREAILASTMPLISEAGERYTRPVYSAQDASGAAAAFARTTRIDEAQRDRVFAHVGAIRRDAGALAAVRMAGIIQSEADAARLAGVAERYGRQTLALHHALGPGVLDLARPAQFAQRREVSEAAWRNGGLAAAFLLLAIGLVVWVGLAGFYRMRGAAPGLVERVDGQVSRLILGRNS
ncbi:MAG: hypothetical protein RIA71_09695 [Oceanicaulis sp.]